MTGDRVCVRCDVAAGEHLDFRSQNAIVDYFRCAICGHVWVMHNPGRDGTRRDITPLTDGYWPSGAKPTPS
jgi:hypothetical protein